MHNPPLQFPLWQSLPSVQCEPPDEPPGIALTAPPAVEPPAVALPAVEASDLEPPAVEPLSTVGEELQAAAVRTPTAEIANVDNPETALTNVKRMELLTPRTKALGK